MTPLKILVVEDAEALRKDVIEMLSFEGYDVTGAANGVLGVKAARENRPDLIICDIMMPELDGFGVLNELHKDGAGTIVPFIFLTAKTDKADIRHGMESGADDYLTKPFTAAELIESVKRRLQKIGEIKVRTEESLNDLRDNIILALPHELRTPLTGILGFSDILVSDSRTMQPEQIAEMAQYIFSSAQRLYRLTENYLVYAQLVVMRTDGEHLDTIRSFTTPQPATIIENTALVRAQQYERAADLQVSLDDNASIHVLEDNLRKIAEELADNAFKFSKQGTPVQIEGQLRGKTYVLTVMDYGRGMAPDQVKKMGAFMQFGRKLHEQQGAGFGLTIVKISAELYGGSMSIDSVEGQYTKVTVTLPADSL
jgi:two-component system sensor histidine kinase/response regulator